MLKVELLLCAAWSNTVTVYVVVLIEYALGVPDI